MEIVLYGNFIIANVPLNIETLRLNTNGSLIIMNIEWIELYLLVSKPLHWVKETVNFICVKLHSPYVFLNNEEFTEFFYFSRNINHNK